MTTFLGVIATIAALFWLVGGIYAIYAIRHFIRGCDKLIGDMAADIERGKKELDKWM